MKIILVGAGKMGTEIIKHVCHENHEVIVIDSSSSVIESIINEYDVMGYCGKGASYEVLKNAGVDKADLFIAVTESDEANMLACLMAKKIGAKHTIARVRDYEYTNQVDLMTDALEITRTINPELESAREILRIINFPEAARVDSFAHGSADITEFYISEDSPLVGMSLKQINSKLGVSILICAVKRGKEVVIPNGNFVLEGKDRISLISSQEQSKAFISKLGLSKTKMKDILIIGASRISYYLAEGLVKNNYNVKIIELNPEKANEFAESIPQANVIVGDGSDQNLLRDEGMQNFDAVVCLTGNDEQNIIVSLYANQQNVKKIITKVNKASFAGLLSSVQMGSVIFPQEIAANQIVSYVRASSNVGGNNIITLHKIVENQVEVSEFIASSNSKALNIQLKDLNLKKGILIGGIIREHQIIIPSGMTSIQERDSVIIVSKDIILNDLDDILV
ncbi:MAG: Trk system potassium transporter TrkA [Acholeplasmatales bacterium]|nr:Trk system potassium transporter TrkA [Acholeplasmatales bacterium]